MLIPAVSTQAEVVRQYSDSTIGNLGLFTKAVFMTAGTSTPPQVSSVEFNYRADTAGTVMVSWCTASSADNSAYVTSCYPAVQANHVQASGTIGSRLTVTPPSAGAWPTSAGSSYAIVWHSSSLTANFRLLRIEGSYSTAEGWSAPATYSEMGRTPFIGSGVTCNRQHCYRHHLRSQVPALHCRHHRLTYPAQAPQCRHHHRKCRRHRQLCHRHHLRSPVLKPLRAPQNAYPVSTARNPPRATCGPTLASSRLKTQCKP